MPVYLVLEPAHAVLHVSSLFPFLALHWTMQASHIYTMAAMHSWIRGALRICSRQLHGSAAKTAVLATMAMASRGGSRMAIARHLRVWTARLIWVLSWTRIWEGERAYPWPQAYTLLVAPLHARYQRSPSGVTGAARASSHGTAHASLS